MNITLEQKVDKKYYEEFYSDWLKSKSKFRKWQKVIGIVCVLISILIYFSKTLNNDLTIIILAGFGILQIFDFYYTKNKWMKNRLNGKINNSSFSLQFKDDEILTNGPFTKSNIKWDFFQNVVESNSGLFLIPENGVSIYLQKKSFSNTADINKIINRINKTGANKV